MRTLWNVLPPLATVVAVLVVGQLSLSRADDTETGDNDEAGRETRNERSSVPADPDRSLGGYDIWMTRDLGNGRWSVPVNLGPNVNSTARETGPAVSPDGELLYLSARGRPDALGRDDIYVCAREGKGWGPASNLGPAINTTWEEIGPCPFPDLKTLLFSRRDPVQRSYDLAVSVKVEGEWLEAIGLGRPLATPGEERFATITADGKELYFSADWRAGRGSYDIWQSYRDDRGNWSEAINLGPRINTRDPEYSPAISPDGERLFFGALRGSSRDYDIYLTERKAGGTWQDPIRLPEPVNSRYNEYCPAVAPDGKTLYFSSDRSSGREVAPELEE